VPSVKRRSLEFRECTGVRAQLIKQMTQDTGNNGDDNDNQHYLRNVRKIGIAVVFQSLQPAQVKVRLQLFPESMNRLLYYARQVLDYSRQCVFHSDRYITCIRCKLPYRLSNFIGPEKTVPTPLCRRHTEVMEGRRCPNSCVFKQAATHPDRHEDVLARARFGSPRRVFCAGRADIVQDIDGVLANYLSTSFAAPHLFGVRLQAFEADFRAELAARSPSGLFWDWPGDTEILLARKPS
jgi:hypothetical protein